MIALYKVVFSFFEVRHLPLTSFSFFGVYVDQKSDPQIVLMNPLQFNKLSEVNHIHIISIVVYTKKNMPTKYNKYALNAYALCCITRSSSLVVCDTADYTTYPKI